MTNSDLLQFLDAISNCRAAFKALYRSLYKDSAFDALRTAMDCNTIGEGQVLLELYLEADRGDTTIGYWLEIEVGTETFRAGAQVLRNKFSYQETMETFPEVIATAPGELQQELQRLTESLVSAKIDEYF